MNILIILGHPKKGSFNHAVAEQVVATLKENKHDIYYHDLYEENFNPVIHSEEIHDKNNLKKDIIQYCNELSIAEGIVIIHPNWWGQPPAILKGWIDRIVRPKIAYKFENDGSGIPKGLLKVQNAVVFNTTDTEKEREKEVFGDPLERIWKDCIFAFCGVNNFYRLSFGIIVSSTVKQRKKWLKDVEDIINYKFPR